MYSNATPINLSSLHLYVVVCLFLTAHTLDEAPMRIHYQNKYSSVQRHTLQVPVREGSSDIKDQTN